MGGMRGVGGLYTEAGACGWKRGAGQGKVMCQSASIMIGQGGVRGREGGREGERRSQGASERASEPRSIPPSLAPSLSLSLPMPTLPSPLPPPPPSLPHGLSLSPQPHKKWRKPGIKVDYCPSRDSLHNSCAGKCVCVFVCVCVCVCVCECVNARVVRCVRMREDDERGTQFSPNKEEEDTCRMMRRIHVI